MSYRDFYRKGTRVLFTVSDRVVQGQIEDGRKVRGNAVLVRSDGGACYWREPHTMILLGAKS